MLLLGIALVAIGAMTLNVPMLLAGAALLGVGIAAKAGGFNLQNLFPVETRRHGLLCLQLALHPFRVWRPAQLFPGTVSF